MNKTSVIHTVEGLYINYRISSGSDRTSRDRHDPASTANVKICRLCTKAITVQLSFVADNQAKATAWMRSPTALCFMHRPQEQARTGITDPWVGHSKVNRRLPQWQLPSIFSQERGSGIAVSPSDPVFGNELKLSRGAEGECPLLAQSRHELVHCTCPLSKVKQTWPFAGVRFRGRKVFLHGG